ncbi:recombinase family protein [Streptomyces sp. NPDC093094]|uniref:recombinase family protein n=1 Tax=Streptomyces sp. NPDC093094 TaxID=3366026 RepID=UPI003818642A
MPSLQFPAAEGRWTVNRVQGLLADPKLTGYQVHNRKATPTGRPGISKLHPLSEWIWSPRITHEPVISVDEWKAAQEVTAGLKAGAQQYVSLQRLREEMHGLGLSVTAVSSNGTHTLYRIGERQVVLPDPIPAQVIRQVAEDARAAS